MTERGEEVIIHCAETIKGGIATYLNDLIPCQAADLGGRRLIVVVPGAQLSELKAPDGVKVVSYKESSVRVLNSLLLGLVVAREVLLVRKAVVHIHSTFAGLGVRPILFFLRWKVARVVYCAHGWAFDRPMSKVAFFLSVFLERFLALLTDKIVCISNHDFQRAKALGVGVGKLSLVLNGVRELQPKGKSAEFSWKAGRLRILFVGRFDRQKGVDLLFAALERLGGSAQAFVAGGAVLGDHSELRVPDNVTCLGWMASSDLEEYRATADVMVVPSRWEGFGLVAVEAARSGLAVVAARTGGLTEIVEDGVTGAFFEAGSVDSLVSVLQARSPSDWKSMGGAARRRFEERFTMERVHQQLLTLYGLSL